MKRDYISLMSKPNGLTAVKNLAEAFEHYNEWHPRSALGYRSPPDVDSYKELKDRSKVGDGFFEDH